MSFWSTTQRLPGQKGKQKILDVLCPLGDTGMTWRVAVWWIKLSTGISNNVFKPVCALNSLQTRNQNDAMSTGASNKPDPLLPKTATTLNLKEIKHWKGSGPWTPVTAVTAAVSQSHRPTSSMVSSCGVAALSSESFWEPASALFRTSLLFLCLWANFLACPSALPLLSRRTGLVSHLRRVLPGRLGPGELCAPIMWG